MSGRLPIVTPDRMIRALVRAGFAVDHQTGSHAVLLNEATHKRTVVPVHRRDLARALMKSILKQVGLTEDEFRKLL